MAITSRPVDNGGNPDIEVGVDARGGIIDDVPLIALIRSDADTLASVTADGVLVNLGANNDVTVTGTVTVDGSGSPQPVTGPLTDAQLRAVAVPVSGSVTATGPLTDAQLRAVPVPVSGTVATGGLTDAELRAAPVPVSGTVTATGGLTDAELRATPVPVSGTVAVTGVATAANQATLIGHVDGLETLGTAANALLATIDADTGSLPGIATSVDGIEALLTTIDADTGNLAGILTAVQGATPAGTNNIGDVDVLTLPALPAGTNNIGDVDVLTLPKSGTSTDVSLASSATSAQVLAANANRLALTLTNTDANGVYVNIGGTASASVFTVFIPGTGAVAAGTFAYWEMPQPPNTEAIHAIWTVDGSGALIGTELAT